MIYQPLLPRSPKLSAYSKYISQAMMNKLIRNAKKMGGLKVTHVSATALGGGVAATLLRLIPFMKSLGIDTQWIVLKPDQRLFNITKSIHNYMQGKPNVLSDSDKKYYLSYNRHLATCLDQINSDIWIIHDPQPYPSIYYIKNRHRIYIWYCHIDLTAVNLAVWRFMLKFSGNYDHFIFSTNYKKLHNLRNGKISTISPGIEPLSPKNKPMTKRKAEEITRSYGIDVHRPLITQVSRLDPWKDPIGVIDSYRLAKKSIPRLQLAFVAQTATDDPESTTIQKKLTAYKGSDRDIHIIINAKLNDLVVNAFQRRSDIIIQKSLREGFGQTVTEAMWKYNTVIGGDTVGIRKQITSGYNGYIVKNIEECAQKIVYLLHNPNMKKIMGYHAHDIVKKKFLLPRLAADYLDIFKSFNLKARQGPGHLSGV